MATSTSLSPQQVALPQMITLYHTLAAAQTSFISNIKTPLQADTTGFCEGGRETSPCDSMLYSPIIFIYTGFICYSRLRRLRRCWQRRKVTVLCVAPRYAPLCVLWLFTLCWWIVALVIALYRDQVRFCLHSVCDVTSDVSFHWQQVRYWEDWGGWSWFLRVSLASSGASAATHIIN